MRRKNIGVRDLLPFVTTVDCGIAELVRKQEAGWAYIQCT
jgi:intracellular sulfur oxidation DsrE/DsrF family protein